MEERKMMRAVAKTKPGPGAEQIDVPIPVPAPDEVLVKITSCALCGTDVHRYQWLGMKNDPRAKDAFPRILGHEFCGEVVALGSKVDNIRLGQRVTSETHVPCGECFLCKTGNAHNCQNLRGFRNGIFAEYAVIPARTLVKIPDSISDEVAATLEPFCVAVQALEHANVFADTVLITGAGPIGLYTVQLAKAAGASRIYVSDISAYRRELALAAGADIVLDPTEEDIARYIKTDTDGLGVGFVFETSGSSTAFANAFDAIRKCGTFIVIGIPSAPLTVDVGKYIVYKSIHIHGIYGRTIFKSWETALQMLASGRIRSEDIITHRIKLFADYKTAFEIAQQGMSGKIVFSME